MVNQITKDKKVLIHYTLTDEQGTKLDSSLDSQPLTYFHGYGYLIKGLEDALENKTKGEKFNVTISPENAYGFYDETLITSIPKERFDFDGQLEVGMPFQMFTANGPSIVTIKELKDNQVIVDANHQLAGKTLTFDIEIIDVLDATEEELNKIQQTFSHHGGCGGNCNGCHGCSDSCEEDCNCDSCDCDNETGCCNK